MWQSRAVRAAGWGLPNLLQLADAAGPFLLTAALVALNEMGDKSQFLAMAFAARMRLSRVLAGIFCAAAVMAGLAVAAGALLGRVPGWQGAVQLISSTLFLVFCVWTLCPSAQEEKGVSRKGGGVAAVFTSFLFAEMGDKTQLVTMSLAARFEDAPLQVLGGAVLGFLLADGLGVFAGSALHRHLPERALRALSAALFLGCGLAGLWEWLRGAGLPLWAAAVAVALGAVFTLLCAAFAVRKAGCVGKKARSRR